MNDENLNATLDEELIDIAMKDLEAASLMLGHLTESVFLAKSGSMSGQREIAEIYRDGCGHGGFFSSNIEMAVKWYTKAAKQGSSSAMYSLGTIYQFDNLEQNDSEAVKLENHRKAIEWYKLAASKKFWSAHRRLADIYSEKGNYDEAANWLNEALYNDEKNGYELKKLEELKGKGCRAAGDYLTAYYDSRMKRARDKSHKSNRRDK